MSCDRSGLLTAQLLPHRLRGRACSKDGSIDTAYPSSSSSNQSWHISLKRIPSKAQTAEDSSLSSTEGQSPRDIEFEDPPGSTSDQGNLYRRRSHRPRGCRGGRKNRKKQLAKSHGVLLPKDIIGGKADSNRPIRPDIYDAANRADCYSSGLVDCFGEGPRSISETFLDENSNHLGRGFALPFQSLIDDNTTSGGLIGGVFYPQRALVATSQQIPGVPSKQVQTDSGMPCDARSMIKPSKTVQEILPPPPPERKELHETRFEGQNPYALTSSKLTDRRTVVGVMNHSSCATSQSNQLNHRAILGNDDAHVNDAHAAVESHDGSGSLFATSPRSFLMGFDGSLVRRGDRCVADSW